MKEKELRALSRADLLQMLIDQSTEVQELRSRLAEAEAELERRDIAVSRAGTMAEAALLLNGVFEAADKACAQYIENMQLRGQAGTPDRQTTQKRQLAEQLLQESRRRCEEMERQTQLRCSEMLDNAKKQSQAYWDNVKSKLDAYYEEHAGLRELMALTTQKNIPD